MAIGLAAGLAARLGQGILGIARAGRGAIGRGLSSPKVVQGLGALRTGLGTASTQAGRFGRAATQTTGRPMAGRAAAAGRTAGQTARTTATVSKAIADDVTKIAQAAINASKGTSAAAKATAARTAILQKYPQLGNVAGQISSAIRSGRTSLAGLDIKGLVASAPSIAQAAASRIAASPIGQRVGAAAQRVNRATNPNVANPAADAAASRILGGIGGLKNTAMRNMPTAPVSGGITKAANAMRNLPSKFPPNIASKIPGMGGYAQKAGAGSGIASSALGKARSGLDTIIRMNKTPIPKSATAKAGTGNPFNLPDLRAYGVKDFIPSVGGTLGAAGRAAKGIGSFSMKHPFIATGLGTAGVMYGPDAYDAATTAMFGKSPEQQFRQGVDSLMGTEENRRRTLGDLGALYAQGELGEAIGTPGARNLSQQQMRQYLGGSIFGDEGYANIPMRGGSGMFGGEGSPTMAGDIFNNPARESIMRQFGTQMNDEEIMEKYAEILDKQRKKKSLDAEDLQFLMMFEALSKPTNLPSDQFRRNQGFETQRAYNDVQNQLGGQFEVIDYNQLYPTYAQPQTTINMADGGEVARRVPDVSFSRYAQGGVANLMDGGAANGPGTGTSDSIPARLSDGEFVMTSDAVRGMGDGSRKDGVRKMYDLMNSLEAK